MELKEFKHQFKRIRNAAYELFDHTNDKVEFIAVISNTFGITLT